MTKYTPSVQTTFLPKTNGMVFDPRLKARSDKGRVFGSHGGEPPYEPLNTVQGAQWDPSNVYELGEFVYGTSAIYSGGTDETLYRSRIQRRDAPDAAWENAAWESHGNVQTVVGGELTHLGQVRFQTQAKDDNGTFRDVEEQATDQVNSFASVKTVTAKELTILDQPVITGDPYVGSTITCSIPRVSGGVEPYTYNYTWLDIFRVKDSRNSTTLLEFDKGNDVACYVQVSSADGQQTNATSNAIGPVIWEPVNLRINKGLEGEYDLSPGVRSTVMVEASGVHTLSYTWQYKTPDDAWRNATLGNFDSDYPDAEAIMFEVNRDNEPGKSTFMINIFRGPGPTSFRCRIRDTDPDGTFDQNLQTTTLNYTGL